LLYKVEKNTLYDCHATDVCFLLTVRQYQLARFVEKVAIGNYAQKLSINPHLPKHSAQ